MKKEIKKQVEQLFFAYGTDKPVDLIESWIDLVDKYCESLNKFKLDTLYLAKIEMLENATFYRQFNAANFITAIAKIHYGKNR